MPLSLQPKLLRVLEERCFYRLGGVKRREFKARVVCAGNRDLSAMVENGQFRRDLYHRLRVGHLRIPPLRERPEDIPVLAGLFLQREAVRKKKRFTALSPDALRLLGRHPWTGNVRELENAVERAVLLHDGPALTARHLSFLDEHGVADMPAPVTTGQPGSWQLDPDNLTLPDAPFDVEALVDGLVRKAVERFGGNKSRAAAHLGISRFALHRRLAK
ncbi:sigma 54-interacting transcriptional regulator [Nitratidesulfovibrio termitidis]|uniref:sigma 54-interacting transcriptional regulator n=1 Tax=Nitratidesulfovibrio termitidis TaxID=42252 RepID=UPI002480F563|nr:sigma 54-interacting transcriptional regulator [Nitratidesulfovibrio termitidis]